LPIIPVRVEGALMPTERDLVPSLIDLLEFNAAEVTDSRWDYDVDRLLWAIDQTVEGRLRPSAPDSGGDREAVAQAQREAEDQARQEAEAQAQREAEAQARQEAEAEAQARREAEAQARREAEEQARRDAEVAEHSARTGPPAGEERARVAASPAREILEPVRPRSSRTAVISSRPSARILAAALAIGGVVVLVSYLTGARPGGATILSHLPSDLRASCAADTDTTATCHLHDGTVVFYRLYPTVREAEEDVSDGESIEQIDGHCPPFVRPTADNRSDLCWYTVGSEKGLARFGYTAEGDQTFYSSRWVPDGEPLRGEMSTTDAALQDWTTLQANWSQLVSAR